MLYIPYSVSIHTHTVQSVHTIHLRYQKVLLHLELYSININSFVCCFVIWNLDTIAMTFNRYVYYYRCEYIHCVVCNVHTNSILVLLYTVYQFKSTRKSQCFYCYNILCCYSLTLDLFKHQTE